MVSHAFHGCLCINNLFTGHRSKNQQCVVYKFKCDPCDADYVGYTCRNLFQRIEEHSAIGKHLRDAHNQKNKDLREQFAKCRGKFESFIQENKPELNTQSDSKQIYLVPNYYPLRSTV